MDTQGVVRAAFAGTSDPDFRLLVEGAQAKVLQASIDHAGPFEVRLGEDGELHVEQLPDMDGPLGSVGELNALLGQGLPDAYTEGVSLADDPLWAAHLQAHW